MIAILGTIFLCLLLVGCVENVINMSSGTGTHDLGPVDETKWDSSKESQQSTDSINELSSRISGIDKSNQEIKKNIDKTSETQQMQQKRNEAIDRVNPNLPKDERRKLYK